MLLEAEQYVTVEVPDADVKEIQVNGVTAERYRGNVFRSKVMLKDGVNDLVAVARDKAGNETRVGVRVMVDTTPPTVQATVNMIVEGDVEPGSSVLIDVKEVEVDAKGHYRAEVPIRKGQSELEIVAIDPNGNKTVRTQEIGE